MSTTTSTYAFTKPSVGADSGVWGGTLNGDLDSIDTEIGKPRIPFNSPTVGATTTCDLSLARVFVFTVSQITTLAFTNVPSASFACRIRLLITNGSAFAVTFPASVTWLSGVAPTFKAAGVDEVDLMTKDGGTTWYGSLRADQRTQLGTSTTNVKPAQVLFTLPVNLSTSSTSEVSLASVSVPANALAVNGSYIRVTLMGLQSTQAGNINIKFGATSTSLALVVSNAYDLTCKILRTGAATQRTLLATLFGGGTVGMAAGTPAETLSGAILLDIRGSVTSGGTLNLYGGAVEVVAA